MGSFVRPRRKTVNLGKKLGIELLPWPQKKKKFINRKINANTSRTIILGPPQRVKKNEDLVVPEERETQETHEANEITLMV